MVLFRIELGKKNNKRTHSDIERDLNNKNKAVTVRNR